MALDAIALLRLPVSDIRETARYRELSDGVLARVGASFTSEPEELAIALRRVVGDALDRHRDSRGVLVMPEVAAPKSATYEDVVTEIGEGGTWVPIEESEDELAESDLLSMMMGAMANPGMQDIVTRARDAMMGTQGDLLGGAAPDAASLMEMVRSMSQGIEASSGEISGELETEVRAVMRRTAGEPGAFASGMPDLGALMNDPGFQSMVNSVREQLLSDPAKFAELQALFASEMGEGEAQDEDEKPSR